MNISATNHCAVQGRLGLLEQREFSLHVSITTGNPWEMMVIL